MILLIGFTLSRFLSFLGVGHTERPTKRLFDKDAMPLQAGLTMLKLQETLSLLLESGSDHDKERASKHATTADHLKSKHYDGQTSHCRNAHHCRTHSRAI